MFQSAIFHDLHMKQYSYTVDCFLGGGEDKRLTEAICFQRLAMLETTANNT